MDKALVRKPGPSEPERPTALQAALAVEECAKVIKLRVGTTIGTAMTREALSIAVRAPEAFGREDLRSLARRLANSASVFLDDQELADLRQALDQAIQKHLGDRWGAACSTASR